MNLRRLLPAATLALALAAPLARAQDVLETTAGSTYEGKITANDGTSVEIETTAGAKMKLPYGQLTPKTQYRLKKAIMGTDAKSLVELADWCVATTLYDEAKVNFRKALAADALMADEINEHIVKARTTAANELLARGKALQATNPQEARRVLSLLVQELPLEEAAQEATQLLATETTQRKEETLKRRPARASANAAKDAPPAPLRENGEPFSEATRTLFAPVIDSYRKMLDMNQDGLVKGDSAGIKEFEKAIKEGEKVRKATDKLRPQDANNEEIAEAIALADAKLEEAVVDVRINLSDSYLLRSSYNQAAEAIKLGLAEYPKNDRLRQAMNRVTAATSDNGGGGWVIAGPRR